MQVQGWFWLNWNLHQTKIQYCDMNFLMELNINSQESHLVNHPSINNINKNIYHNCFAETGKFVYNYVITTETTMEICRQNIHWEDKDTIHFPEFILTSLASLHMRAFIWSIRLCNASHLWLLLSKEKIIQCYRISSDWLQKKLLEDPNQKVLRISCMT